MQHEPVRTKNKSTDDTPILSKGSAEWRKPLEYININTLEPSGALTRALDFPIYGFHTRTRYAW